MMSVRQKQFLLGLLGVSVVAVVGVTAYWAARPEPQQVTSEAGANCTAAVRLELDAAEPTQVGNLIYPALYAYLDNEPLGMAAVTISYDPNQLELDRSLMDPARVQNGEFAITAGNYMHDPNLDTETSAIFALPEAQKLHVLASCKYVEDASGAIGCNPSQNVWGEDVGGQRWILLAVLPLKVKGTGDLKLSFENIECGAETTQSVVLGSSAGLDLASDRLGSASGASYCGMDVNLDGSTNAAGEPTITALDFREWLVYFKDYVLEGNFFAPADFNCDSRVNALDFSVFLREFRKHLR